jgi:hypothetical protein
MPHWNRSIQQAQKLPCRRGLPLPAAVVQPIRLKNEGRPSGAPNDLLLLIDEVPTAVLLPASFVALIAERFFLAVADRLDAAGADSCSDQCFFHSTGALVAERDVVFGRAALVAVALDGDVDIGVLAEELRVRLHRCLLVAPNVGLVVIEIDIFYVLIEQVLIGDRWRRWWRRRCLRDRKPRSRFLRSTRTFCYEVIGGRVGWRDRLRPVGLHRADAVDGNIRRVACLPGQ